jgi:hypothetical protein
MPREDINKALLRLRCPKKKVSFCWPGFVPLNSYEIKDLWLTKTEELSNEELSSLHLFIDLTSSYLCVEIASLSSLMKQYPLLDTLLFVVAYPDLRIRRYIMYEKLTSLDILS